MQKVDERQRGGAKWAMGLESGGLIISFLGCIVMLIHACKTRGMTGGAELEHFGYKQLGWVGVGYWRSVFFCSSYRSYDPAPPQRAGTGVTAFAR